ncbi:MAG: hypothetical protein H7A24_04690 [Leptospiraceae bacterium]|nr:hypothetical protein [Leptospiraceae bacterium]MCP5511154.1 hypothetical protein [Leptospiraceae bacterium]
MTEDSSENLPTPFHSILFVLGGICLLVFLSLFLFVYSRNQVITGTYENLNEESNRSFSVIKEYHRVNKNSQIFHVFTYNTKDDEGNFYEVTEYVDTRTYQRLRIGDNALILRKSVKFAGQKLLISRINGNQASYPKNRLIESFSLFGVFLSGFLVGLGFLLRFFDT